jgi:hypothetical protein
MGAWRRGIELKKPIPNLKDNLDGKACGRVHLELEDLAARLGLPGFDDLTSMDAEELAELGASDDVVDGFEEQWFDPAEGLKLVQGLLDHLRGTPGARARLKKVEPAWVLEDLEEAAKVLRAARGAGVKFHFNWAH